MKDDHGLADQRYSPFAARVAAVGASLRDLAQASGRLTRYVPSLSGSLDAMRRQIALARDEAIDTVMIAPMIAGFAISTSWCARRPTWPSWRIRPSRARRASRRRC